jgi:excisionase family DNA binding protein
MSNGNTQGNVQVGGAEGAVGRSRNFTARDAAEYLGITLRELKGLRARKALPFYRIGHRTVTYNPRDLDAFLDKCRVAAA